MSQRTNKINHVPERILMILEANNGVIFGTWNMACALGSIKRKDYVIRVARRMQAEGRISIIQSCGGRGRMTKYKSNEPLQAMKHRGKRNE